LIPVTLLKKKLSRAKVDLPKTQGVFESLTKSLPRETVQEWKELEEEAMSTRGDALEIYEVQLDKGDIHVRNSSSILTIPAAPSQAEIRLTLTENEKENGGKLGSISWLTTGINIEQAQ
jgi:hypothetical protein